MSCSRVFLVYIVTLNKPRLPETILSLGLHSFPSPTLETCSQDPRCASSIILGLPVLPACYLMVYFVEVIVCNVRSMLCNAHAFHCPSFLNTWNSFWLVPAFKSQLNPAEGNGANTQSVNAPWICCHKTWTLLKFLRFPISSSAAAFSITEDLCQVPASQEVWGMRIPWA